jgi:hypothetical protein
LQIGAEADAVVTAENATDHRPFSMEKVIGYTEYVN